MMKAVITVLGSDRVGIIAAVTAILAEANANILEITQTIMRDIFTMIMIVDVDRLNMDLQEMQTRLAAKGTELGVEVRVQREDIFANMHRI